MDEWELDIIEGGIFRNTDDGLEFMDLDEAQRRLNATERLSAELARRIADALNLLAVEWVRQFAGKGAKFLKAYADILEEK